MKENLENIIKLNKIGIERKHKMEQDVNWDLGRTYKIATLFEEY